MPTGPTHLFIPGPTNVPEVVRRAVNVPMQDHRAPDFPELTRGLFEDLKKVFANSTGRVFVYPSSGTGAWEAAITNTLRRGDRVLMAQVRPVLPPVGRHGDRGSASTWCASTCRGARASRVDQYAEHLAADPSIRGGLRDAQRDLDRRHLRRRRRAAGDGRGRVRRAALRRRGLLDRVDRLPSRTRGESTSRSPGPRRGS